MGGSSALVWHHNLPGLMLGASCSFEVSDTVPTEHRNPEETEEVMTSGSTKDESNSGVSVESLGTESKPCSRSVTAWSRNK